MMMGTQERPPTLQSWEPHRDETTTPSTSPKTTLLEAVHHVKELARSGLSPQEIADRTGLRLSAVYTGLGRGGPSPRRRTTLMSDAQFERTYAPADYRHKQLESKLDRIIQLLSEGRG